MCHLSLRLWWRHICKSVQKNAEKNVAETKTSQSILFQRKKDRNKSQRININLQLRGNKTEKSRLGPWPSSSIVYFQSFFSSWVLLRFLKKLFIYFGKKSNNVFLIGDMFQVVLGKTVGVSLFPDFSLWARVFFFLFLSSILPPRVHRMLDS